jgi:hypothetical protein
MNQCFQDFISTPQVSHPLIETVFNQLRIAVTIVPRNPTGIRREIRVGSTETIVPGSFTVPVSSAKLRDLEQDNPTGIDIGGKRLGVH